MKGGVDEVHTEDAERLSLKLVGAVQQADMQLDVAGSLGFRASLFKESSAAPLS